MIVFALFLLFIEVAFLGVAFSITRLTNSHLTTIFMTVMCSAGVVAVILRTTTLSGVGTPEIDHLFGTLLIFSAFQAAPAFYTSVASATSHAQEVSVARAAKKHLSNH